MININFRGFNTFFQFLKYTLVGCSNFIINLSMLNLLMFITGIYKGNALIIFQILSFITYSINGYLLNKKFTFKSKQINTSYFHYAAIMGPSAILSAFIIRTFSLYNLLGVSQQLWTNIVILTSSILVGILSFTLNKLFVFK